MLQPLLLSLFLLLCPFSTESTPINVWPKPTNLTWTSPHQSTLLSPTFTITITTQHQNNHLSAAIIRYTNLIKTEHHRPLTHPTTNLSISNLPPLQSLTVTVTNPTAELTHATDESYTLTISTPNATLTASTPWGAMRGMETFSQLTYGNPTRVPVEVRVSDAPLFGHRGLTLDTSRNYYPVKDLLRTIEAMSMNKMNVFHWHITDSHSFPLVVPSEPMLAEKGAYDVNMVYTVEDVTRVVEFGLDRGVRVLPEIDSPGHTGSWALAYPDIVTCANMFWWPAESDWPNRLASEPGTGHLNPLNPKTYQVLKNVIRDVTTMFPEQFYHSGADEVIPGCWKTDPTIQKFLSNGGTLNQVLEMFINNTLPYIVSLNRTVVYWEDVLLDDTVHVSPTTLPKEHVILQTWNNGHDNTKRIVSSGYRAIVSSSDFYYLDCGHGDFTGNNSAYNNQTGSDANNGGSWCGPFKTWQTIYNYDITYGLTEEEAKLVLGGEVALWLKLQQYYGYQGVQYSCRASAASGSSYYLRSFTQLSTDENYLVNYLYNYGPVTMCFTFPSSMQYYSSGVINLSQSQCEAQKSGAHAVTIIGFGTDSSGVPFFTAKNSWGLNWGENGFFRFRRNVNFCNFSANLVAAIF